MDRSWGTLEEGGTVVHRTQFLGVLQQITRKKSNIEIRKLDLPQIVAFHRKKFSFSGNAETLFSELIISAINSFCNLRKEQIKNLF